MRRILKWAGRVALALLLVAIVAGVWKRDEIARLYAVNTLFDAGRIVQNFSHMDRAFLTVPVPRGDGPVSPLPDGPEMTLPEGAGGWMQARGVTSLLVLHKGRIVKELYRQGTGPDDKRISWSMAKGFLSALFGIVRAEGAIGSLGDPVTKYAPRLKGSAYDGATIRNVLHMTSGVAFDEDYLDYHSDINRMGRVLALGGSMDGFAASLRTRAHRPGSYWHYVSIDTHVLGMIIRGATGRALPDLMSQKVIAPLGLQSTPYYLADGEGTAFALGGLNMTTRDYARFGLMVAQGGRYGGRQVVPAEWIAASTRPSAPTEPGHIRYGYQWWIPATGDPRIVMARGIYGQYIYIDPTRDVVIVVTAADRHFRDDGVNAQNIAMLRRIAEGG